MPAKLVMCGVCVGVCVYIYIYVTASAFIDQRWHVPDFLYWPYRCIFICCTSCMDILLPSCHICHADTLLPASCTSPIKTSLSAQLLGTESPPYLPAIYPYRCQSTCPLYWRNMWLSVSLLHLVCNSYVVVPLLYLTDQLPTVVTCFILQYNTD